MENPRYFIYILTNFPNTIFNTGVTNDLLRRVIEHREGRGGYFTKKYHCHKLVYYEAGDDFYSAIEREKQMKAGSRTKKIELDNSINPKWEDLFDKYG